MRNDGLAKIELPFYQIKEIKGSEYLKTKSQLLTVCRPSQSRHRAAFSWMPWTTVNDPI